MRTLFVLPSLARAGAESQLIGLVNGLGPAIEYKGVFCFDSNIDQRSKLAADVEFFHYARRFKFDIYPIHQLARVIDEKKIDVVHCTLPISLFMAWCASRWSQRKPMLIATLHTTLNQSVKAEWFDHLFYKRLLSRCDAVVCVCYAQFDYWKGKFPFLTKNGCVIHNGIDVDYFVPAAENDEKRELRRRLDVNVEGKIIVHVAAFRPEKGHSILIGAFKTVLRRFPCAVLIFAGDGPLRGATEKLVREESLSANVRFLGNVTDVRPVVRAADVSVLASTAVETFSMAMLESLAMEVPMVATAFS